MSAATPVTPKQDSPRPIRLLSLGLMLALMLIAFLVTISLGESSRLERAQKETSATAIENGAALYSLHCRTCHGAKGEGVGQLGPEISGKKFFIQRLDEVGWQDTLDSYIYATMSQGRLMATRPMYAGNAMTAVMSPWLQKYGGPLRADELNDITAFVLNWRATAMGQVKLKVLEMPKANLSGPMTVARGEKVFTAKCAACHAISGLSQADAVKGPDLSRIATIAATRKPGMDAESYLRESFLVPAEYLVKGYENPVPGQACGGVLTVRELDDVVGFLLSRR